jgi:two-component system alkaline phosphatase synthesis response regulator PhoP
MKVMICEAEAVLLSAIEFRLRKHGLEMTQTSLKDAEDKMEQQKPDLFILDTERNPAESLQLLKSIRENYPKLPILIVSSVEEEEELWKALQSGADDFVTKPFKLIELVLRVRKLLNYNHVSTIS